MAASSKHYVAFNSVLTTVDYIYLPTIAMYPVSNFEVQFKLKPNVDEQGYKTI